MGADETRKEVVRIKASSHSRRPFRSLAKTLGDVADAARQGAATGGSVNVTHRVNIEHATNIGQDGAVTHAEAVQHAPIEQADDDRPH